MKSSEEQLNSAFRALAEGAPESGPAVLEEAVMQAFRRQHRARMWRRRRILAAATGAIAAGLVLTAWLRPVGKAVHTDSVVSDFEARYALPGSDPLEPEESGEIVRVQLTLPFDDARVDGTVEADVLLGEDGRAHAVRFLP